MRYPQPIEPIITDELPINFPYPNVTLPKDRLRSFNQTLRELATWAAEICGTKVESLCSYDLLKFAFKYKRMKQKLEEYESLLVKYSEAPEERWSSGYPGKYDPGSGWTGEVSGYSHRYPEARDLIAKWKELP